MCAEETQKGRGKATACLCVCVCGIVKPPGPHDDRRGSRAEDPFEPSTKQRAHVEAASGLRTGAQPRDRRNRDTMTSSNWLRFHAGAEDAEGRLKGSLSGEAIPDSLCARHRAHGEVN